MSGINTRTESSAFVQLQRVHREGGRRTGKSVPCKPYLIQENAGGLGANKIFDPERQSAYPREGPEDVRDDGLGQGLNSSNSRSRFV